MGAGRFARARVAVAALVVALAGCVGPAVVSSQDHESGAEVAASGAPAAPITEQAPVGPSASVAAGGGSADATPAASAPPPGLGEWREGNGVVGVDVSRYQEVVDWSDLVNTRNRFVYVKATEGTSHVSPTSVEQREGAGATGLLVGAYHYARPDQSSGTLQARFFSANGGQWSPDGLTLPGALDLEFNTSGDACYGLSPAEMVGWVRDFSEEYRRTSGRRPVIYTKAEMWDTCTAGDVSFGDHPLWLFDHAGLPGSLPAGWERPTLWQHAVVDGLDRNVFFGSADQLSAWATAPLR